MTAETVPNQMPMSSVAMTVPKAPAPILRGPLRDLANRIAQGAAAPKAQERIWIDPTCVTRIYTRNPAVTTDFKRRHSGMVIGGNWDVHTEPLDHSWKIAACLARFRDGASWEDTGVFEHMRRVIAERGVFDSCRTEDDIRTRYAAIDALFEDIKVNGYRDTTEARRGHARLSEGVFVHIDRNGQPIFGAIGNHRMGIARALRLTRIPAQLGVTHPDGLAHLARYRDAE